jgi:uncharacterized protein YcfL
MKTRTVILLCFLAAPAAWWTGGCTTVNSVSNARPVAQRQMLPDRRVITDGDLNRRVNVLGVNTATGPGGFLKIQLELQNRTSSLQSFTYRVEWFDENGMRIDLPTSAAIPLSIEGKETMTISATAPTERAKDFSIKFLAPTN